MLSMRRLQVICVVALTAVFLLAMNVRLAAQQTTATIQGTVSDSSGGVIPAANFSLRTWVDVPLAFAIQIRRS